MTEHKVVLYDKSFSEHNMTKMKEIMTDRRICKGEWLYFEGDPADKLFFIKEGIVKLTKTADDGKEIIMSYFKAGDLFGEFALDPSLKYHFNAEIVQTSLIGVIQQADLRPLLYLNSSLAVEFIDWSNKQSRFTQLKLRDLILHGKQGALASTLIRMANTYGCEENDSVIRISAHFTNSEIAKLIGSTRETVNRMLHQLKTKEVIDIEEGTLLIKNLQYLKDMCHCEECSLEICRL